MEKFLTKSIFFVTFTFLFLGTGSYVAGWVGIFSFLLLFVYYFNKLEWNLFNFRRIDFIAWLLFLGSCLLSFIFTKSIPASFEELAVYLFAFFLYYFFLLFPKKLFSVTDFVDTLLLSTVILSALSIFSYLNLLPFNSNNSITLINHYFGHNHLAALLLLALPLAYYRALTVNSILYKLLALFLFISMILTFGRVATVLSVFQLIIMERFFSRSKFKIKQVSFYLLLFFTFLIMGIISFPNLFFENSCESYSSFRNVICKNISDDGRAYYWMQAFDGFKENIIFGTGPGTFFLTNEKYKQLLHLTTPYAHNAYIQFFSELGLIGGVSFLSLVLSLLYLAKKSLKNKALLPMFIGFSALLVNVFFDFDFSISSLFFFTCIYIAVLISNTSDKTEIVNSLFTQKLAQATISLVALLLLAVGTLFFTDLIITSKNDVTFKKESFLFNSYKDHYFKKYSYEVLYPYFLYDHDFLVYSYENSELKNKTETFYKIRAASSMSRLFFHDFELFQSLERLDLYKQDILDSVQFLAEIEKTTGSHFYSQRRQLMEQFMLLYTKEQNFISFFELVTTVNTVYPWLHYKIDYSEFNDDSRSCHLTQELQHNIGEPFGDQRITVANIYLSCLANCKRSFDESGSNYCHFREKILENYFEYTHKNKTDLSNDFEAAVSDFNSKNTQSHQESLFFEETHTIIRDIRPL